jgi:hypothetical protein
MGPATAVFPGAVTGGKFYSDPNSLSAKRVTFAAERVPLSSK